MNDNEKWKFVEGYEILYEVSDCGNVRNCRTGKILKLSENQRGKGYYIVILRKNNKSKTHLVHRLVASSFIPKSIEKNEVCHIDGNCKNNIVSNLRWGTRLDNEIDKILHGTTNNGEKNGSAKLTNSQALDVHKMSMEGFSNSEIADKFNISSKTVGAILNFRAWKHLRKIVVGCSNSIITSKTPKIIDGGLFVDDRGRMSFLNNMNFFGVKRFYQINHNESGMIRAWHGHRFEGKYVYVVRGTIIIGAVNLDTEQIHKFVLSSYQPKILFIPPNYANGFMNLEEDTIIMFFSTSTLEESKGDDIRFAYDKWNIWNRDYR